MMRPVQEIISGPETSPVQEIGQHMSNIIVSWFRKAPLAPWMLATIVARIIHGDGVHAPALALPHRQQLPPAPNPLERTLTQVQTVCPYSS
jgi:hypothetical protein